MPLKLKIAKETVLQAAYDIARTEGMEGVHARAIAQRLHCSIQPIFANFSNMQELKQAVIERVWQL